MIHPCTSPNHLGYHQQKVILAELISVSLLRAKTPVWLWLFTDEESRRDKSNEKPELFALRISWESGYGKMEMLGLEAGKHHSDL